MRDCRVVVMIVDATPILCLTSTIKHLQSFIQAKGFVTESTGWSRKDLRTTFCSSMCSGFAMTCTVSPFDRVRTALMNQGNTKQYSGFVDCAMQLAKRDGIQSFWRGFIPIWARFAPTATIQLVTIEYLYGMFGLKSI